MRIKKGTQLFLPMFVLGLGKLSMFIIATRLVAIIIAYIEELNYVLTVHFVRHVNITTSAP